MMDDLVIRPAAREEFAIAVEWAAREGWNPGLDDLPAFHGADPDGFLMGWRGDEPVSSISVVRYGKGFGFLGFYIVHPDHRGTGAGLATWKAGMAHLEGRTVGLDGVPAQQDNYTRSGFVLAGRNVRYSGAVKALPGPAETGLAIRDVAEDDLEMVIAYDRPFFADDRSRFIRAWTTPDRRVRRQTLMAVMDGEPAGYGTVRACVSGYKVGPLFADSEGVAASLFNALCCALPDGAPVSIDVPQDNPLAIGLAEAAGLAPSFETARMYRGADPGLPLERIFGITTFELG